MRVGVIFPQNEIGADPGAIRAFAAAVTELGYRHIQIYDHVLGADPAAHPGWVGPYDVDSVFHEPFVLYGFLAALCPLELVTGVLVLPQRQTALVAKQAAEVDLLTGGRFRLGVGIGWNRIEYEALGARFADRGRRVGEQVALLRRLWTERSVTWSAKYSFHEEVNGAGICPLPVQRPIPIWFGCSAPAALRRAGRLADGWFPQATPGPQLALAKAIVHAAARKAGRDASSIGMEGRIQYDRGGADAVVEAAGEWATAGATHVAVCTMGAGLGGVDGHLAALAKVAQVLQPADPAEIGPAVTATAVDALTSPQRSGGTGGTPWR